MLQVSCCSCRPSAAQLLGLCKRPNRSVAVTTEGSSRCRVWQSCCGRRRAGRVPPPPPRMPPHSLAATLPPPAAATLLPRAVPALPGLPGAVPAAAGAGCARIWRVHHLCRAGGTRRRAQAGHASASGPHAAQHRGNGVHSHQQHASSSVNACAWCRTRRQVSKVYPAATASFAGELMGLLEGSGEALDAALRRVMVQALILLRNRNQVRDGVSERGRPGCWRMLRCMALPRLFTSVLLPLPSRPPLPWRGRSWRHLCCCRCSSACLRCRTRRCAS